MTLAETRIDELRRRLEREPGSRLFAQLAEELRKAGDSGEAIRVVRAGLVLHPAYPSARLTLGRALLDAGDRKAARSELGEAVRQSPESILARRLLGQVLDEAGELPAALEHYAVALRMSPEDSVLRLQIRDLALRLTPEVAASAVAHTQVEVGAGNGEIARGSAGDAGGLVEPASGAEGAAAGSSESSVATGRATVSALVEQPTSVDAVQGRAEADDWEAGAEDEGAGGGGTPFSSSTLAELYFRQGLLEKALEVYRQVLEADPSNRRARARLLEIGATVGAGRQALPSADDGRRQALERTIASLEALLTALRRR